MIIQIFDNAGSATGAVSYVLSSKDWTGKPRSVEPKILEGSAEYTTKIDEIYCSKFKNKCISGVIAFAEGEDITDEQKAQLIRDFENTFLGNVKDNVNTFYVEHRDKGNLEIHFIINRVAILDDGRAKAYHPFPPGRMTIELKDAFRDLQIEKFGFKHIEEKPHLRSKSKKSEKQARLIGKENASFLHLDSKDKLERAMRKLVKDGTVNNRGELLKFLVEQGLTVKNTGKSISIENKHVDLNSEYSTKYGSYFRFSGGMFERNNDKSYSEIKSDIRKEAHKPKDFDALATKLEKLVGIRNAYNTARFKAVEKNAPKFARRIAQAVLARSQVTKPIRAQERPQATKTQQAQEHTQEVIKTLVERSTRSEPAKQTEDRTKEARDYSQGSSSTGTEAVSAQEAVNSAMSALTNAKTPAEAERARVRLGIAKARLNEILTRLEAEKTKTKLKI